MNEIEKKNKSYTPNDGFPYYLDLVKELDYLTLYSSETTTGFFNTINEEQAMYRYAPEKWSIKQIVGHITDHERIKIYRAFLMSRNEKLELWGYDQNFLVNNSRFDELTFNQLFTDYKNVRQASLSFIDSLSKSQLNIKGKARQYEVTLEVFLKSIIGHELHHIHIIKERYL